MERISCIRLENNTLSDTVLDEARNAEYPPEWTEKIMEKF